jgi:pilus assembly protein Flp/PilA
MHGCIALLSASHLKGASMLSRLKSRLVHFLKREDGPTAVEYAVMLALILAICIVSIQQVGRGSRRDYKSVSRTLNTTTAS